MRIVFAGTPEYVVAIANFLFECPDHDLVAVYTQCDRKAGRGRKLSASPVKQWAKTVGCPLEQPLGWDDSACEQLASYTPDLMIVMAYGLLLSPCALAIPQLGCVNVHTSLLPRWRGAAPVIRALEQGDKTTGISLMLMQAGLDEGPLIGTQPCAIKPDDTAARLIQRLSELAVVTLKTFLPTAPSSIAQAQAQSDEGVCYAAKVSTAESWIAWHEKAPDIVRKIRAFNPAPVARTRLHHQVLRIWEAETCLNDTDVVPGKVIQAGAEGIVVGCGEGALRLTVVQPAGKAVMAASAFANGHDVVGAVLA